MRREAAGDDVGAVPRGDHEVAVDDPLEEVLQAHRAHDQAAHLPVRSAVERPRAAVGTPGGLQVPRVQRLRDLGDGGGGQDRRLRQGRRDQVVADDVGQPGPHRVDQCGIDAVGDHSDQRAAAVAQRRDPRRDRVEHLLDGPPARADDQQHRGAQVVRGVDVEVELDGQRPGRVVAALDDHDVRGGDLGGGGGRGVGHRGRGDAVADHGRARAGGAVGDRPVGGEHAFEQPGVGGAVGGVVQVVEGQREGARVLLGQAEAVEHEREVGVVLAGRAGQRAEEPQPARPAGQDLDQAEDHRGLAGSRLERGDVDVAGHAYLFPGRPENRRGEF